MAVATAVVVLGTSLWGDPGAPRQGQERQDAAAPAGRTVVLELFTSEGCSSCPPADRLLEELAGTALAGDIEIVPLSLHVDYWNHLGWRDPYSQALFSRRQESYAAVLPAGRVYTPQLVVDGEVHLVGSDRREALAAIAAAARRAEAVVELEPASDSQSRGGSVAWRVSIDAAALEPRPASMELFVAVTEDGLESSVSRGENAGRRLGHIAVTRSLLAACKVPRGHTGLASHEVTIMHVPSWMRDRLHLVAWIAGGSKGPILGAARAPVARP
jgi:hypothetical protein